MKQIFLIILVIVLLLTESINCQSCSTACSTILGTSASSSSDSITATCSYINCSIQSSMINFCMRCTTNIGGYLSDTCSSAPCKANERFNMTSFMYAILSSMAFILLSRKFYA